MDTIVLFRIGERLTLTAVVLLVALVVMVGFWRAVQKVELKDGGSLGVAGSFMFSTPVFVLLAIIGYAWVSLEHPISVGPAKAPSPKAGEEVAAAAGTAEFVGATPRLATPGLTPLSPAEVRRRIGTVNCLAKGRDLTPAAANDLADVKLRLLAGAWEDGWGSVEDLRRWSLGLSGEAPPVAVQALFFQELSQCES